MTWYRASGGAKIPDGNDIAYPVVSPSQDNKGYKEESISAISSAIGAGQLTVAEMPAAIITLHGAGLKATNMIIDSAEYTSAPLEAT